MSIIKHVTLQKIVAHDFRYDPRIYSCTRGHSIRLSHTLSLSMCVSSVSCFIRWTSRDVTHFTPLPFGLCCGGLRTEVEFVCLSIRIVIPDPSLCTFVNQTLQRTTPTSTPDTDNVLGPSLCKGDGPLTDTWPNIWT